MHVLIALIAPVLAAILDPVAGGEVKWTQAFETAPVSVRVNGAPPCTVQLTQDECVTVAEIIIDVIDENAPGKLVLPAAGGSIEAFNDGYGNVRFATNGPSCQVMLLTAYEEPETAIHHFLDAAAP